MAWCCSLDFTLFMKFGILAACLVHEVGVKPKGGLPEKWAGMSILIAELLTRRSSEWWRQRPSRCEWAGHACGCGHSPVTSQLFSSVPFFPCRFHLTALHPTSHRSVHAVACLSLQALNLMSLCLTGRQSSGPAVRKDFSLHTVRLVRPVQLMFSPPKNY